MDIFELYEKLKASYPEIKIIDKVIKRTKPGGILIEHKVKAIVLEGSSKWERAAFKVIQYEGKKKFKVCVGRWWLNRYCNAWFLSNDFEYIFKRINKNHPTKLQIIKHYLEKGWTIEQIQRVIFHDKNAIDI